MMYFTRLCGHWQMPKVCLSPSLNGARSEMMLSWRLEYCAAASSTGQITEIRSSGTIIQWWADTLNQDLLCRRSLSLPTTVVFYAEHSASAVTVVYFFVSIFNIEPPLLSFPPLLASTPSVGHWGDAVNARSQRIVGSSCTQPDTIITVRAVRYFPSTEGTRGGPRLDWRAR